MSVASGAQHPPAGDVITGTAIRNWWGVGVGVLGAALFAGGAYAMADARLAHVEQDVAALKTALGDSGEQFRTLDRRLRHLDRKLDLILCAQDKTKCTAAITIADDP